MQITKKLFAQRCGRGASGSYVYDDNNAAGIEIENVEDATAKLLALDDAHLNSFCFRTYEVSTVTIDGKEFSAARENHSGNIYIAHYDQVLRTREQRIAEQEAHVEKERTSGEGESGLPYEAGLRTLESLRALPKGIYLIIPQHGNNVLLESDDRVLDKQGRQLWPHQAAPVFAAKLRR